MCNNIDISFMDISKPHSAKKKILSHDTTRIIERKMLYVIGLGLSDEKDITVKGLEAIKSCKRVYIEAYTSILMVDKEKLVSHRFERLMLEKMRPDEK